MQIKASQNIDSIWGNLAVQQLYRTPDIRLGVNFTISDVSNDFIIITTHRGSHVRITRASFVATLFHLYEYKYHSYRASCRVASNNNRHSAGPLCVASRTPNRGTRCINYILPILQHFNLVGINGHRPNRSWYI